MKRGAILIITTWIIAILALFAVGIGFRTGLDIKLTGYNLDRLKALYIAKAGINKGITAKWEEYVEGVSLSLDAFSEPWSNDAEQFKNVKLGDGSFTLKYAPGELDRADKEIILYGLEDETSRISINSNKSSEALRNLFMSFDMDLQEASAIAAAIEDWRDADTVPKVSGESGGAEDLYYQSLEVPYTTSGAKFAALEELLLVKGITERLFYERGLYRYLTAHTSGGININTACEEVLDAIFGIGYQELALKVINYRKGMDGKVGTDDDRYFVTGRAPIDRGSRGLAEVKDLNDENWYGNIFGITDLEYKRIRELAGEKGMLATTSDYYRATVTATVGGVTKNVVCVVKFNKPQPVEMAAFTEEMPMPDVEYLCWHEER